MPLKWLVLPIALTIFPVQAKAWGGCEEWLKVMGYFHQMPGYVYPYGNLVYLAFYLKPIPLGMPTCKQGGNSTGLYHRYKVLLPPVCIGTWTGNDTEVCSQWSKPKPVWFAHQPPRFLTVIDKQWGFDMQLKKYGGGYQKKEFIKIF